MIDFSIVCNQDLVSFTGGVRVLVLSPPSDKRVLIDLIYFSAYSFFEADRLESIKFEILKLENFIPADTIYHPVLSNKNQFILEEIQPSILYADDGEDNTFDMLQEHLLTLNADEYIWFASNREDRLIIDPGEIVVLRTTPVFQTNTEYYFILNIEGSA